CPAIAPRAAASFSELEVFVAKIGRRDAVLAHQGLHALQQAAWAAEADLQLRRTRIANDGTETLQEVRTRRTVRYRNELRAATFGDLAQTLGARKLAPRRKEIKERHVLQPRLVLVVQPRDERRDAGASGDPSLSFCSGLAGKASERCIDGRMHARAHRPDQAMSVVAEVSDHEMNVAVLVLRARDREWVRLAQRVFFHRDERELPGRECDRILHGLELEMQRCRARRCAYDAVLRVMSKE